MSNLERAKEYVAKLHVPKQPYRDQRWGRPFAHEMANLADRGLRLTAQESAILQQWFGQSIYDGSRNRCDWEPGWNWRY